MVIFSKSTLTEYGKNHADSLNPLLEWYKIVRQVNWSNVNDVKKTFNSADYVGNDRFVFNIKGNRYHLVAAIKFNKRTIFIKFIGTHAEYDKIDVVNI
jgi:mRNA interferase HigB